MPSITPRTAEVVIYQGDDLAKLRELYQVTEMEDIKAPARKNDPVADAVKEAAKAYDAFVDEAAERAIAVTIQQVGRRRWRQVRDECPPRKDDEADQIIGYDRDALGEILVPESIIAPVFNSTTERADFLDMLSEADWERLVTAVIDVNTTAVGNPKGIKLESLIDQESDESSKPPARRA